MGLSRKKKGKIQPEMNVTPLVDVFLVLLIIFMVILPAAVSELNIEMTKIQNPDASDEEEAFELSIDREGNLYFEDYRVEPDQLANHLRNANAAEPTKKLVLIGDYRLEYGDVREVMATVQDVGFPGVNLRATKAALDNAAAFAKSIGRSGDSAN